MMEFPIDKGDQDSTRELSPLEIIDCDETREAVNRIITLYNIGDYDDAEEELADLLLDWSGRIFELVGYGHLVDDSKTDWYTKNPAEVFDCKVTFQRPAIIDDKFCLVFWPESDIVNNPDGSQRATAEIVVEKGNILDLQYTENKVGNLDRRNYTDKTYLDNLASRAHRMMSLAINRPDLPELDRPDTIRKTADSIKDDEEISDYIDTYRNRVMRLSPRRYFIAPPGNIGFDASLCLSDGNSEPMVKGLFSGLTMIEELDPNHQPNMASLCIKLLSTNDKGEIIEYYVPMTNLISPPICDWNDKSGTA